MHKIYGKWLHNQLVISELPGASISKRILVQKLSFENEFDLHENDPAGETHFLVNSFVMAQRQTAIRKSPGEDRRCV